MSAGHFLMADVLADFVESPFAKSEGGGADKIGNRLNLAPSLNTREFRSRADCPRNMSPGQIFRQGEHGVG